MKLTLFSLLEVGLAVSLLSQKTQAGYVVTVTEIDTVATTTADCESTSPGLPPTYSLLSALSTLKTKTIISTLSLSTKSKPTSTTPSSGFLFSNSTTAILSNPTCVCTNNGSGIISTTNGSTISTSFTDPDWSSFPNTTLEWPPSSTIPVANPLSDEAVIQLIVTTQEELLNQYNLFGTVSCIQEGSTTNCAGPWLYGSSWNNHTLESNIFDSTVTNPSYYCSSDTTYLSSSSRIFYGFASDNITDGLENIAHSASMFAAMSCTYNTSCATTYANDTAQMYMDFRSYINTTFFKYMADNLPQNDSSTYCPADITSPASLITLITTPFSGSTEYFGLHNAIFIPEVAEAIDGTVQEAILELGVILANNAHRVEGVFLNMIFFTYGSSEDSGFAKRSSDPEDMIYPDCSRRDWVVNGCPDVIPPRDFDRAGKVVSMKDRDRAEVLARLSPNSGELMIRDATCDDMINNINNAVNGFEFAKSLFDDISVGIALLPSILNAAEAATVLGLSAPGVAIVGGFVMMSLMMIASCEAFNTCGGFPPSLIAAANAVFGKMNTGASLTALINIVAQNGAALSEAEKASMAAAGVLASVGYLGLIAVEKAGDAILDTAIKYNQDAAACCASTNCASAACQQAALGCLLLDSSFFSASEGVGDCGIQ